MLIGAWIDWNMFYNFCCPFMIISKRLDPYFTELSHRSVLCKFRIKLCKYEVGRWIFLGNHNRITVCFWCLIFAMMSYLASCCLHASEFTNCMTIVECALLFIDFVAGLLSIKAYVENLADPKDQQVVFIKLGWCLLISTIWPEKGRMWNMDLESVWILMCSRNM